MDFAKVNPGSQRNTDLKYQSGIDIFRIPYEATLLIREHKVFIHFLGFALL